MVVKFKMKFVKEVIFIFTFIIGINAFTQITFASEKKYNKLHEVKSVKCDKTWIVKFNHYLSKSTLKDKVKILDEVSKEEVDVKVKYNNEDKFLEVMPIGKYKDGGKYILIIKNGIESSKGKKLLKSVRYKFICNDYQSKEIKKSLLHENFKNPGNVANNKEEFYNIIRYSLSIFKSDVDININNYNSSGYSLDVIADVLKDNPILDYGYKGASASISLSKGKANMKIQLRYNFSPEQMENMKKASQIKADKIIKEVIKENMNDYEKELALHDYIVNHSTYDKRVFYGSIPWESYTDYGVLVKSVGVCESYAKAMYRLLNSVGIKTLFVIGEGKSSNGLKEPHAWNIVKLHGKYYQLDVTWDNPIVPGNGKQLTHDYFNLTDDEMRKDHIWDNSKYPKCYTKTYAFKEKYVA